MKNWLGKRLHKRKGNIGRKVGEEALGTRHLTTHMKVDMSKVEEQKEEGERSE